MIKRFHIPNKIFNILPNEHRRKNSENTVTVIVGKNGTGKSRLLRNIVLDVLERGHQKLSIEREEQYIEFYKNRGKIKDSSLPSQIICVSTSPFDKFPLLKNESETNFYHYLGLKDLTRGNLSNTYIAKIISEIIKSINTNPEKIKEILSILTFLGYEENIECTFSTFALQSRIKTIDTDERISYALFPESSGNRMVHSPLGNEINFIKNNNDKDLILNYLKKSKTNNSKPRISLTIDKNGVKYQNGDDPEESLALISTGFAKLRNASFKKQGSRYFEISDASSGEQSVVMSSLGIASKIVDNSLICIDEPDICLHPERQEKYIPLLLETFSKYNKCQFIIATHSPQIIAALSSDNCFVMNMEDGHAVNAIKYADKSIDYQLVNVFKTPGMRNEYLNRIAINLFIRVSKSKSFSFEDVAEMKVLNEIFDKINKYDPLKELISALQLIWDKYGSNK